MFSTPSEFAAFTCKFDADVQRARAKDDDRGVGVCTKPETQQLRAVKASSNPQRRQIIVILSLTLKLSQIIQLLRKIEVCVTLN